MMRRNNGGLGPELFLRIIKEITEVKIGEVQLGRAGAIAIQTDPARGEYFAEVVVVAFMPKMSADGNFPDQILFRIADHFVILAQPARAAPVDLSRTKLAQGLVWSYLITLVQPTIKATLLRGKRRRRRLRGLGLQVAMPAFMRTIFLRRSGTDELNPDALIDPPHAQLREPAQRDGGKRRTVIHPDDPGQPTMAHQLFEGAERAGKLLIGPRTAGEVITAEQVAYRQRIAPLAVA